MAGFPRAAIASGSALQHEQVQPPIGIAFDLDGTLYAQRTVRLQMALRLATYCVRRPAGGTALIRALQAYRRAQESLRTRSEPFSDLAAEQVRLAAESVRVPPAQLAADVERWFVQAPLPLLRRALRPGLLPLLDRARAAGRRLAVVSDYPAMAKLEALGLAGQFESVVVAQDPEVGCFKPNPRGLEVLLERWQLAPEQCVYVGDRADTDAEAARRAGVRCIILGAQRPFQSEPWAHARDVAELRLLLGLE